MKIAADSLVDRATFFARLRAAGVVVTVHCIPVHPQPHFRRLSFAPGDFPEAEAYYAQSVSLPMYAGLPDSLQDEVIAAAREAMR